MQKLEIVGAVVCVCVCVISLMAKLLAFFVEPLFIKEYETSN